MRTITKKIDTHWFDMILAGKKKFELRLADFDIADGDTLRLEEWIGDEENRKPSGRFIDKKVTYVQKVELKDWIERQPSLLEDGFYVIQFD